MAGPSSEIKAKMDAAATKAEDELSRGHDSWAGTDIARWFLRNYRTAGYKRLGKILVEWGKELETK